jgi:hypothetical protein
MHENLLRLKLVNQALANLGRDYVFVGGATFSLYATNLKLAAHSEYCTLDEKLKAIGFKNEMFNVL